MTNNPKLTVPLKPLFFGRITRVVFGAAALYWGARLWNTDLASVAASLMVILLGLSFLVGGLMANLGCEVTALVNLVLPAEKRVHSF
jgi:hypothetical protein